MKDKKTKTLIFHGLGFPVKLINASMKKVFGEWCFDINLNKLMKVVLEALIHKPTALTGGELEFIRSYLKITLKEVSKLLGVSQAAVLKWEKEKNKISPSLELCIRLYVLDHLQVKDAAFRAFYKDVSLGQLSKSSKAKARPLIVDVTTEEFKIAPL